MRAVSALFFAAFALLSGTAVTDAKDSQYTKDYVTLINKGQTQWQAGGNLDAAEAIAYQNLHLVKAGHALLEYGDSAGDSTSNSTGDNAKPVKSRMWFGGVRCFFGVACKPGKMRKDTPPPAIQPLPTRTSPLSSLSDWLVKKPAGPPPAPVVATPPPAPAEAGVTWKQMGTVKPYSPDAEAGYEEDFDHIEEDVTDPEAPTIEDIPPNFDARIMWFRCRKGIAAPVLSPFDNCLADYVTSVVSALQDRWCIQKKEKLRFSAAEILKCNGAKGGDCQNGSPKSTYQYFRDVGVVTGRQVEGGEVATFNESDGCIPFGVGHPKGPNFTVPDASICEKTRCTNGRYDTPYTDDKMYIYKFYRLQPEPQVDEATGFKGFFANAIKLDILQFGPVTATINFYEDILFYKKGVYRPLPEAHNIGEITLKIFGWGIENGIEYWLATNIWSKDFGDEGIIKLEAFNPKLKTEQRIIGGRYERLLDANSEQAEKKRIRTNMEIMDEAEDCC